MNIDFEASIDAQPHFHPRTPLDELKTRARIRLNALISKDAETLAYASWIAKRRRWSPPQSWKLHHALSIVSTELGFRDWEHARAVLSGTAAQSSDMGDFWYDCRCQLLLNHWFVRYEDARAFLERDSEHWLFPYRRQFVIGNAEYVRTVGLDPEQASVRAHRDVSATYGTEPWARLCSARLAATRSRPLLLRHF